MFHFSCFILLLLLHLYQKMNQKWLQPQFKLTEWELLQIKPLSKIYRHRLTSQHCEQYLINVTSQSQKIIFLRRKNQSKDHLVSIFHCQFFHGPNVYNQTNYFLGKIYIEKITIKLDQIIQLPVNSISQFLEETLMGFKIIYNEYQPVRITPDMICFNEFNKTKIWLSSNLLENFVNNNQIVTEQMMVEDIFNIYEKYTKNYLDRKELMNFDQALEYLDYKKLIIYSKSNQIYQNYGKEGDKLYDQINKSNNLESSPPNSPGFCTHSRRKTLQTNNLFHQNLLPPPKSSIANSNYSQKLSFQKPMPISPRNHEILYNPLESTHARNLKQTVKIIKYKNPMINPNKQVSGQSQLMKSVSQTRLLPTINIQSARTTSKNINLQDNLIELDKNEFQLQLIDEKKSKQVKLDMIQNALQNKNSDENIKKICKIYNHALKYDPIMYNELQKVQGRISKISNMHILKRLIQVSEGTTNSNTQSTHYYRSPEMPKKINFKMEREQRVDKILEQERMKRNKQKKSLIHQIARKQSMQQVGDYGKQLESFLQKQNIKKQANTNVSVSNISNSFNYPDVNPIKNNYTSKSHITFQNNESSQLNDEQSRKAKAMQQYRRIQKSKLIQSFKDEFQKILFQ